MLKEKYASSVWRTAIKTKKPFQVVVRARARVTIVAEVAIGDFSDRLEAEQLIEKANENVRADHTKRMLGDKFPNAIISVEMNML